MKILLGVCGSIAAYKTYDLCRGLVQQGHQVQIILTQGALEFIKPQVYFYLGAEKVFRPEDDFLSEKDLTHFSSQNRPAVRHVQLADWCDRLVICPLSANTLGKLARGEATDLLTSVVLALPQKPLILYPAMNTKMLDHPFTMKHYHLLSTLPYVYISPTDAGLLACGDRGLGKLPPIERIIESATTFLPPLHFQDHHVLITAGATISPLDPIRYLTNASSGKTGYHLAKRFLSAGYKVTVIAGKNATSQLDYFNDHPLYTLRRVITTSEMEKVVFDYFPQADIYISSAAICDFEFEMSKQKIKKQSLPLKETEAEKETQYFSFKKTTDILSKAIENRRPHQKIIGFAAETLTTPEVFIEKWKRKPVDLLIGNPVHHGFSDGQSQESQEPQGMGTENGLYFFLKKGKIGAPKELTKIQLADEIFQWSLKEDNE